MSKPREIKFRAWFVENQIMYSWEDLINRIGISESTFIETKLWKPMQYTGLKGKNGVEIYEGDVVESVWQVDHKTKIVGQVKYYSVFALWSLMDCKGDMVSPCWNDCEVIGNNHEHHRLLEKIK